MSLWQRIGDFLGSLGEGGGLLRSIGGALDPDNWLPGGRDAAFTLSLVALSAKMAVADGIVTNSEIAAFKSSVDIPPGAEKQIERLFDLAQQDVTGYRSYAKKIKRLFKDNPETLEQVLESLFFIASADGMIHRARMADLREIGRNSQGVRLMNLPEDDRLVGVAKLAETDEEDTSEASGEENTESPDSEPETNTQDEGSS